MLSINFFKFVLKYFVEIDFQEKYRNSTGLCIPHFNKNLSQELNKVKRKADYRFSSDHGETRKIHG